MSDIKTWKQFMEAIDKLYGIEHWAICTDRINSSHQMISFICRGKQYTAERNRKHLWITDNRNNYICNSTKDFQEAYNLAKKLLKDCEDEK